MSTETQQLGNTHDTMDSNCHINGDHELARQLRNVLLEFRLMHDQMTLSNTRGVLVRMVYFIEGLQELKESFRAHDIVGNITWCEEMRRVALANCDQHLGTRFVTV